MSAPASNDAPASALPSAQAPAGIELNRVRSADQTDIAAYERPIFGADRKRILASHLQRSAAFAQVARASSSAICIYALGRPGFILMQIGPILLDNEDIARALLARSLHAMIGKPVLVDTADGQLGFRSKLEALGFAIHRPFIRMARNKGEEHAETAMNKARPRWIGPLLLDQVRGKRRFHRFSRRAVCAYG